MKPLIIKDDLYAQEWVNRKYNKKLFQESTEEIYTNKGERVRSKSEKIIVDMLSSNDFKYKYE